ncbi:MAG TPA: DUF541 domain-containing protein [Pseudomonas xinjiangensis]|uniref:DUF541 domain-containing protein n=2 Tax=root TaxID=1 RepID=A0A7V1BPG3_9GAMM|nr:DUF541 domain-containing protein [Halopseudomonas xinjiangensis]HEC48567.1 DUF541 domain-containing protein [Halopseudomonas xinjiangensis]
MRHLSKLALLFGLATLTLPALADQQHYNQVSLRAEVQQSVSHDTLRVTFYAEDQDAEPAKLAERITRRLNQGLETARGTNGVKVSSGNRSSHPVYDDKHQTIVAWRERGEIILESTDFPRLTSLTAQLLNDLSLGDMQFSLSPTTRRTTEDELIKRAIEAFRARSDIATRSLGGSGYKIVSLNLNTQFMQPPVMFRGASKMSMAADREMSVPSVEGGQADVTVSADGVIEVSIP